MGQMGPLYTQKGGPDPPGNQNGGPRPLWGTILITFGYYFQCFSIIFTTAFRLCRTIFASINIMPTLASPPTTQTATNQGAGGRGEAFISAAPACGEPGRDAEHPFKICQTLSENLSLKQPRPFRRATPILSHFGSKIVPNRVQNRFKKTLEF